MIRKPLEVKITTSVSLRQLALELSNFDHDVIKDFVKELDGIVADYKFTKSLRDYFVKEIQNEDSARDK